MQKDRAMTCKICDKEECKSDVCIQSIEDTKQRIREQRRKYYKSRREQKLCRECSVPIESHLKLCDECRARLLKERTEAIKKKRSEMRACRGCKKPLANPSSPATRYCEDNGGKCKPDYKEAVKRVEEKTKKPTIKKEEVIISKKKDKDYGINPYFLRRGNISIHGERMFGHGKSITRL